MFGPPGRDAYHADPLHAQSDYSRKNWRFRKALFGVDLGARLGEALKRVREEAALTQIEMARRLGVSQPTLHRLERGDQNITLRVLGRLCASLRCEPGDLFHPGSLKPPRRR
jgi:DNA-binding XRE family transcriptional regulator